MSSRSSVKPNTQRPQGQPKSLPRPIREIIRCKYLYLIFLIPFIYYIVFQYWPMYGILISFQDYNVVKGISGSPWVGFKHFEKFLFDDYFWTLVRNTLLINIYNLLWGFPAPIILAILLNELRSERFKKVIQNISYLPHFISTVVVCGMLVNFLSSDGLVNQIVKFFGGESIQFLMYPQYFRTIYVASGIWQSVGWNSIIYLAALTGIDAEMFEAALIDGANRWHRIRYITLPSIAPTISIMLILNLGRLMNLGHEKILLLYNGSTYETADVISTYVYRRGLLGNDFSYATAVNLFQAVVGVILVSASNQISKKVGETSLW
ncbi:MAG: sugar ABC transporter permease [Oscillospiraceae bacterium]|nr:sugar ABC transporter permease [Oscillospiraceae bacterium]